MDFLAWAKAKEDTLINPEGIGVTTSTKVLDLHTATATAATTMQEPNHEYLPTNGDIELDDDGFDDGLPVAVPLTSQAEGKSPLAFSLFSSRNIRQLDFQSMCR
jgi:hypothetical protein